MRYRLKRDLNFYRGVGDPTIVTVKAGTVIEAEYIPTLDPLNRDAFERRLKKEHKQGFPHGELVVFLFMGGYRYAYSPADLEPLSWS